MRLSRRLKTVGELVLPGEPVADIGSDHALLPTYLVCEGICPRVIIGELNEGPCRRAREFIRNKGLEKAIEVRKGNGLEVLAPFEVATVIMAGLGGKNIAGIVMNSLAKAYTYRRFVLQPMLPYHPVRKVLADLGWPIVHEEVVVENGNSFVILVTEPKRLPAYHLTGLELDLGPIIIQNATRPENRGFLLGELERYRRIVAGLKESNSPTAREKLAVYRRLEKELAELIDA